MNTRHNTVLITGGSSGIGLAMARAFLARDNTVIVAGRSVNKLNLAKEACPGLHTIRGDISKSEDRHRLVETVTKEFPRLNLLVNNAAAGHFVDLRTAGDAYTRVQLEVETNFVAPVHLVELLFENLSSQTSSAIVNVTTIGAFLPIAAMPGYSGSKAALHSYTKSLRLQLASSTVRVFEVIPPAVDTEFVAKFNMAKMPAEQVAEQVLKGIEHDREEIFIGVAKQLHRLSRLAPKALERLSHAQTIKALDNP